MPTAPKYLQISADLTEEIKAGKYRPGAKLPSEYQLMQHYGVSRNTVRSAIGRLSEVGLVSTRRGSGCHVTSQSGIMHSLSSLRSISEVIRDLGFEPGITNVSLAIDPNPKPELVAFLRGQPIWVLRRIATASGKAFAVNDSWLPDTLARKLDVKQFIKLGSLYQALNRAADERVAEAVEYISAEAANPREAAALEVAEGVPLLVIQRYTTNRQGQPLEFARSAARGDMYRYFVKLQTP